MYVCLGKEKRNSEEESLINWKRDYIFKRELHIFCVSGLSLIVA